MSELDAAYALAQPKRQKNLLKEERNSKTLSKRLTGIKHVTIPSHKDEHLLHNFYNKISRNRDVLQEH